MLVSFGKKHNVVCLTIRLVGTLFFNSFLLLFAAAGVDAITLMSATIKVRINCFFLQILCLTMCSLSNAYDNAAAFWWKHTRMRCHKSVRLQIVPATTSKMMSSSCRQRFQRDHFIKSARFWISVFLRIFLFTQCTTFAPLSHNNKALQIALISNKWFINTC